MGNIPLRNISLGNIVLTHKLPWAHSHDFNPDVELLDKHYRAVAPHYGNVKLVRDKNTSEAMLLKEIFVNTKEAFEQELRFFNNRISLKHANVVDIIGFTSEETKNFCSNYFKVSVFFEVLEKNLQTDLEQRIKENKFYSENELFLIADNLISALSYFQNQGHAHGDIRPFNIFVKGYTYKLSDPSLNPKKLSNGLTLAIVEGAKTLLAPELLEQIPQSQFEIKTDIHKADVFSLGATLLGLATLTNAEGMYDYKAGKLNINVLEERLETLKNHYSAVTYDLIKSMLTLNVNERNDFLVFTNRLFPYQEEIRSLRPLPFASSTFTPYEPVHTDTQIHQYDTGTHHHYEEIVKKTGPNVDETHTYTHVYLINSQSATNVPPNDDLDAQVKAAIDRTEENLKIFDKNYLVDEKENIFKTSLDYGAPSTQLSFRPLSTDYLAGVNQPPAQDLHSGFQTSLYSSYTNTAEFGEIKSEILIGSHMVQELSYELEELSQKLEAEGITSVPRRRVVIDPVEAYKEVFYASSTLAEEGQKALNVPSEEEFLEKKIEQEAQDIMDQEKEIKKSPEKEKESSSSSSSSSDNEKDVEVQPEDQVQIQTDLEKKKLKEKEFKEISQESLGRQEGEIEVIDQSNEQERPPALSEIQV